MVSLSLLRIAPVSGQTGGNSTGLYSGHSEHSWGGCRNQRDLESFPIGSFHCLADLGLVEEVKTAGWGCGGGLGSGKGTLFFFFSSSNLYPPLTPVPQCVAEFRAIGQSPIHCHPEYFKVKPPCLTKKSYSSKVYFSSSPSSPSFCSQSQGSAVVLLQPFSMVHCFVLPVRQEWEKLEVLKLESLKFEFNEVQFSLQ